jgi:hypothetical protein
MAPKARGGSVTGPQVEVWRPCPGFEEFYQVSDHGRVRRIKADDDTWVGRVLKPSTDKRWGYHHVSLWKNGKGYPRKVHRLVAQAFIPNPLNLPEVNHKKGTDKTNNRVSNLEWTTRQGNSFPSE